MYVLSELGHAGKHREEEPSQRRPEAMRGIVTRSQFTRVGGQKPHFHPQEVSVCKGIKVSARRKCDFLQRRWRNNHYSEHKELLI